MTPRELLEACDDIDSSFGADGSQCHDIGGEAATLLVEHVRSTVRLDDDEPPTPEWCEAVTLGVGRGENGAWCAFGNTPETFRAMSIWANADGVRLCAGETTIKLDPARRDVRDLCRIVGVELRDPNHG